MKLPNPYQCDREGCTVTKGESNHWWLVASGPDASGDWFTIQPWQPLLADAANMRHACSEACVSKMQSSWMAEMHRRPEAAPEPEQAVSIRKEAAL